MRSDQEIAEEAREKIERLLPGSPWTKLGEEVVTGIFREAITEARLTPIEQVTLRKIVDWDDRHLDGVCLPSQLVEEARGLLIGVSSKAEPASHTPNGYDPRWIPPINEALTDRDGDIVITDISDEVWEQFIGPMLDAIEHDEVEVSK